MDYFREGSIAQFSDIGKRQLLIFSDLRDEVSKLPKICRLSGQMKFSDEDDVADQHSLGHSADLIYGEENLADQKPFWRDMSAICP